jgi:DNA-binding MarR family transcriptional regulator
MASRPPLPTLLSFALVAFTIESDNEGEHRLPHRTTNHGSSGDSLDGPWLVSMAMWLNCLRWVPEQGIPVRELERLARTRTNWDGMRRWGFIFFAPDPNDKRSKPPQSALVVHATGKGRMAQEVWTEVLPDIEARWRKRFGSGEVDELRGALTAIAGRFEYALPDCLPILKYGLVNDLPRPRKSGQEDRDELARLPLPALLARVLLAFALEFERESEVSLAICANVLRVVDAEGTRVRDLPDQSGVSKEAIAMALSYLTRRGYAVLQPEAQGSKVRVVRLTPKGILAQDFGRKLPATIERRWAERYGRAAIDRLRKSLEPLVGQGTDEGSLLVRGLEPYPEGWRATKRRPSTLPHYPMVLHRGGYPDGS